LQKYNTQDVTFASTREAKFITAILEAVDNDDLEKFQGFVFEFDQVSKLDNWKTNILLKIKRQLEDGGAGLT
jgi:alpha-soluble NSF attachment protein